MSTSIDAGDHIDEKLLAQQLGISRTPVREAISRLVAEDFLKAVPHKGVYVARPSKEEIVEIILVRATLEGMAARLAAKNVTKKDIIMMKAIFAPFQQADLNNCQQEYSEANIKFHELVIEKSKCIKLIEITRHLYDQMRMIRTGISAHRKVLEESLSQHVLIIKSMKNGDQDLAEKLMRSHIEELGKENIF